MKVETDLPAEQLALIGCGVTTGVGAALNTAQVKPGSTVAVIGCGGVGQSVIQGRADRRRVAHLRHRPGRDEAQDGGAARRHRPHRPRRRRSGRAGAGAHRADAAPTTRSRSSGCRRRSCRPTRWPRRGGTAVVVGMSRFDATVTFSAMALFSGNEGAARAACTASAQVRRDFPRFVRAGRDRPARHRLDGVASHQARRGQRRVPGDGSGRGHPQRHHLTRCVNHRWSTGAARECLTQGGRTTRIVYLMGFAARDRAILDFERCWWSRSGTEGGRDPYRTGLFGHSLLRDAPAPSRWPDGLCLRPAHREAGAAPARPSPPRARSRARRADPESPVTAPGRGSGRGGPGDPELGSGARCVVGLAVIVGIIGLQILDDSGQSGTSVTISTSDTVAAHHQRSRARRPSAHLPSEVRGQGLQRVRHPGHRASSSPTSSRRSGTTCRRRPTSAAPARAPSSSAAPATSATAT